MVVLSEFINRLNTYLRENNMTNAALAEKLGYSATYISYLLAGKRNPSKNFIEKLVTVSEKSPTWWLHGEKEYKGLMALDDLFELLIKNKMITDPEKISDYNKDLIWTMIKAELKNKLDKKK